MGLLYRLYRQRYRRARPGSQPNGKQQSQAEPGRYGGGSWHELIGRSELNRIIENGAGGVKLDVAAPAATIHQPKARTSTCRAQGWRARPTTAFTSQGCPEKNRMSR